MANVRVRFAPSPTGLLHLGNMRTALFNWLYAKKTGGVFLLRLEDTDRERFNAESLEQIQASLRWLDVEPSEGYGKSGDHGPYAQSERLNVYQEYANKLVENGKMYPCWCSKERLDKLRAQAEAAHQPFKYDRHCLANPDDPSKPHVLRFKIPGEPAALQWEDIVRGNFSVAVRDLDDWVAIKSDGFPTYNFANVIDDHLMEITHVLRGDEFIASTPKHVLLYQAFGWNSPKWIHLPQVLGKDKTKLSKRHGAKTVLEYRDEGYLPDAIINFLALLGWNEGEGSQREIFSRAELIQTFNLERIQKSPAVFDPERLDWMNGQYLRNLSLPQLVQIIRPYLIKAKLISPASDETYLSSAVGLIQERLKRLDEAAELLDFFFIEPEIDQASFAAETRKWLQAAVAKLEPIDTSRFKHDELERALRELAGELNASTSKLFQAIRLAITGKTAAPGLFETIAVLGKDRVLNRLTAVTGKGE